MKRRLITLLLLLAAAAFAQSPGIAVVPVTGTTPTLTTTAGITIFTWTLSANVTSSTFSSAAVGVGTLHLCENGTGGYTVAFPSNWYNFKLNSTALNYCQDYTWEYDGTNVYNTTYHVPVMSLSGGSTTLVAPREYYTCTGTCTITVPVPAPGYEFCVRNAPGVSTVITMAALGSSAMYEKTDNSAYGTAGTGTMVSGGAVGDKICIVGLDATHYETWSYNGTITVN